MHSGSLAPAFIAEGPSSWLELPAVKAVRIQLILEGQSLLLTVRICMPQIVAVLTEELSLQKWRAKLDRFYLYDLLTEPEHRIHIKMIMLVFFL